MFEIIFYTNIYTRYKILHLILVFIYVYVYILIFQFLNLIKSYLNYARRNHSPYKSVPILLELKNQSYL